MKSLDFNSNICVNLSHVASQKSLSTQLKAKTIETSVKDIYINMCDDLCEQPVARVLNAIKFKNSLLSFDNSSVSDKTIGQVLTTVKRA